MIRRFLLDTGIAQDFQDNRNGVRRRALQERRPGHKIGICPPVLGELWSGFEYSTSPERARNLQRLKFAIGWLLHWPYTNESSAEFGRIFADLRRQGIVIQQIDMQIAAVARLLTN